MVAQIPVLGMVARYTYASNTHYTCRPPVLGMAAQTPVLGLVAHQFSGWPPKQQVHHARATNNSNNTSSRGGRPNTSSRDGRPYVRITHTLYLSRVHDAQSQFSGWPPVRTREQHVLGQGVDHHLVGRLGRFLMLYVKTTEESLSLCTEEQQLSIQLCSN